MRAPLAARDRTLLRALRGNLPAEPELADMFVRAEVHGLAGVVRAAVPATSRAVDVREVARSLDHAAHLGLLARIDAAFGRRAIDAVALKGPLLAERLYATPSARVCSDVDLLIAERDIDRAIEALGTLGYRHRRDDPVEQRFRADHHHLHLSNPAALPIELHFHAYRGFGQTLASEPLLARKESFGAFVAIGVLAPPDELVYLAVHAAAHRFTRLSWLYELDLLARRMSSGEIAIAAVRARENGFARVLAFAAMVLVDLFGADVDELRPLLRSEIRLRGASALVREPDAALSRSITRFVYSLALCDDAAAARRYARRAMRGYLERLGQRG